MTYQYRVRDHLGNTHSGNVDAVSVEEATGQLRRDGFQVIGLEEVEEDGLFPRRISRNDLIYVTCQLAIMVDTASRFRPRWAASSNRRPTRRCDAC